MVGQSPGAKPILMLQSLTTSKPTKGPGTLRTIEVVLLFRQYNNMTARRLRSAVNTTRLCALPS